MYTLGLNSAFHDSSACLVKDGRVIAAAEEERFTRVKHGKRPVPFSAYELPFHAIDYCLREAGVGIEDIDHIGYAFDPEVRLDGWKTKQSIELPLEPSGAVVDANWEAPWDPLFISHLVNAPRHLKGGFPHHLQKTLAGDHERYRWHFISHHLAHAASAFLPSPFTEAAIMTLDGRGEKTTTGYGWGRGLHMQEVGSVSMPHSLGMLYEEVTSYLGFLHSSDEYKVMALASYGQPRFARQFFDLINLGPDGQYEVVPHSLEEMFGPRRKRGGAFQALHFDIARSLQLVLEDTVLHLAKWLHSATGMEQLCMAGGVALNCVMNARLRDESPFSEVWVQPAAGDAGTALGAALYLDAKQRGADERQYIMDHAYLGPGYDDGEIESFLNWAKVPFRRMGDVAEEVAELLAAGRIVGWFQNRMEFGPRALGARSILASPIDPSMQERLNEIKDREDFRPVAPVVMEEEADKWFVGARRSPFMLFVNRVVPEKAELIPAVRHIDGTARIQTVNSEQNSLYYRLLKAFATKTGVPVLVNTSFNTRGEPIVCTPQDALQSFWSTPLDALALGSFLLTKGAGS